MKKKVLFLLIMFLALMATFPNIRMAYQDMNYPPLNQTVRLIYLLILLVSFLLFGFLMYLEWKSRLPIVSFRKKILLAILLGILFLVVHPVFSIDQRCYIMQGRILSVYGQNPYIVLPSAFPEDPFVQGMFWKHHPVFYGPVWVLLSTLMTFLAGNSVFYNVIFMKIPVFLGFLLLIWQSYLLAEKIAPDKKDIVLSFFAFNPFLYMYYLIDGHNDILMIALAVWAFNLIYTKKYILGYVIFILSILIKYTTALLTPLLFLVAYNNLKERSQKIKTAFYFAGIFLAITAVSYLPFAGEGLAFLKKLTTHKLFFGKQGIDSNTIPYLFLYALQKLGFLKDVNLFHPPAFIMIGLQMLFIFSLIFIFIGLFKKEIKMQRIFAAASLIFMAYFSFGAFSFGAWFLVWLLPFLVLSDIRDNLSLAWLISMAGAVSFWKRLSFLLIAVAFVYLIILILPRKMKEKGFTYVRT